jgi:cytochrome c oxidase cbb3-type subunit 3
VLHNFVQKTELKKDDASNIVKPLMVGILLLTSFSSFAQEAAATNTSGLISGISTSGFYGLVAVVVVELLILLGLLYNLKFILRKEKLL